MGNVHLITAMVQNSVVISGVGAMGLRPGLNVQVLGSDSEVYNRFACVMGGNPEATFGSVHLAAMMTQFGITGQAISANPLDLHTIYGDQGATRKATGEKYSIAKGVIVPLQCVLAQDTPDMIAYGVLAGGAAADAAPYSVTSAVAVPASAGVSEGFTLGPVTIGGAAVDQVQRVTIDFGFRVQRVRGDGNVWPNLVYIVRVQPTIRVETLMAEAMVAMTVDGTNGVLVATAEKLAEGSTRAGAGDKVFTTHEGVVVVEDVSGNDGTEANTAITVTPTYNGTNNPITVA